MAAKITKGNTFKKTDTVTNIKLHKAVDDASIANINQTNILANSGLVNRSTTSPSSTDSLHADTAVNLLKTYDGSAWNSAMDCLYDANVGSKGYMDGCWMQPLGAKIMVSPGSMMIGSTIHTNTTTLEVDMATEWASGSATGGYDSGIDVNAKQDGKIYFVYAVAKSDGTFNILLDDIGNFTPDYATIDVDARIIGTYVYKNDTVYVRIFDRFRPKGKFTTYSVEVKTDVQYAYFTSNHWVVFDKAPTVISRCTGFAASRDGAGYLQEKFTTHKNVGTYAKVSSANPLITTHTGIFKTSAGNLDQGFYGMEVISLGSWSSTYYTDL